MGLFILEYDAFIIVGWINQGGASALIYCYCMMPYKGDARPCVSMITINRFYTPILPKILLVHYVEFCIGICASKTCSRESRKVGMSVSYYSRLIFFTAVSFTLWCFHREVAFGVGK